MVKGVEANERDVADLSRNRRVCVRPSNLDSTRGHVAPCPFVHILLFLKMGVIYKNTPTIAMMTDVGSVAGLRGYDPALKKAVSLGYQVAYKLRTIPPVVRKAIITLDSG